MIGNIQLGGDGAWHTSSSLKAQLEFHQLYGRFDFDLTDSLHFYATFAGTTERSFAYNIDKSLNNATTQRNQCLPADALSAADDQCRRNDIHPWQDVDAG